MWTRDFHRFVSFRVRDSSIVVWLFGPVFEELCQIRRAVPLDVMIELCIEVGDDVGMVQ